MKTLEVFEWHTVDYPANAIGSAEIKRTRYNRGTYLMEGVAGYDLFEVKKPIPTTILKINGSQVMVDDPLHWIGMQKLAEHSSGRVLIGGLGLGLLVHHLVKNPKITEIIVAELNKDVIELVYPLLPKGKIIVLNEDVYGSRFDSEKFDTIVLDLWVKSNEKNLRECGTNHKTSPHISVMLFSAKHPEAKVFMWGSRDYKINPAVEGATKEYLEFVNGLGR